MSRRAVTPTGLLNLGPTYLEWIQKIYISQGSGGGYSTPSKLTAMFSLINILAGLAIVPLFLYIKNPYIFHDLGYAFRAIRCVSRMKRKQKLSPSFLGCFLEKVERHPQKPFIVFEGTSHTYSQADKQSNRIARVLSTQVQVKEGDTVALFMGNEPLYVWVCLALAKVGCIASLLNSNIRSKSLLHCLSCCDAKVLIAAAGEPLSSAIMIRNPTKK